MDWYIECGGTYIINGQKIFGRKIYINPSDLDNTIRQRFKNIDAYSSNFLYNHEDQNDSDIIGPMYIDLDGDISNEEGYQNVKQDALSAISYINTHLKVPKEYIRIYFSGSKGFHLIIPHNVFGIQPCKDLNSKYKKIALEINSHTLNKTVDTRIYDKKRLIRLPHSINGKTGLYKVPLTEDILRASTYHSMRLYAETDRNINYEKTKTIEAAKQAFNKLSTVTQRQRRSNENTSFINHNYEIPLCIKNIYVTGALDGARNNTLIILASSLLQKGVELEDCIETMVQWDADKNEPSLGEREVETTVRSAYRNLIDRRRYGCASIQELGLCVGNQCKLYR